MVHTEKVRQGSISEVLVPCPGGHLYGWVDSTSLEGKHVKFSRGKSSDAMLTLLKRERSEVEMSR